MLWVDDRWDGQYGIGRYAREVLARLSLPTAPIARAGRPAAAWDALRILPSAARRELVYSPGFNGFLQARHQVLTVHDLIHLRAGGARGAAFAAYYATVVRRAARRSGLVLTVSETSRGEIVEWLDDDGIRVVNAGIGCSTVFAEGGDEEAAGDPYFLYVGNLRPHKNVEVLFTAWREVPWVRLVLVLPPQEAPRAHRLSVEAGIADRVDILHRVPDERLARWYRGAVATLMPSLWEGFGLPALESARCGTPVIFWQGCAAVSETVGGFGIAVGTAGDAQEWAAAATTMRRERARFAWGAQRDRYDWAVTAAVVERELAAWRPR